MSKETYCMSKETYYMSKRDLLHGKRLLKVLDHPGLVTP